MASVLWIIYLDRTKKIILNVTSGDVYSAAYNEWRDGTMVL